MAEHIFEDPFYDLVMLSRPLIATREAYNRDFTGKKEGGQKGSIISWNGTEPSAFIGKTG